MNNVFRCVAVAAAWIFLIGLCLAGSGCGGGDPEDAGDSPFCDTTTPEGKICAENLK